MYFDVTMPITLFAVTLVAMFLSPRIENKLKNTLEEREFSVRESATLVIAMGVTISLVIFVPQVAIMALFLFAYSMLLFMFTYVFSGFQESRKQLFSIMFAFANFVAGTVSLFGFGLSGTSIYGAVAFYCLFGFCVVALVDREKTVTGERWVLAVLPPALFVALYLFFNRTPIWFPYLLDLYGIIFAVLIILYLGSLFKWKTTLIFAVLLTIVDSILVLVTGTMVSAARQVVTLRLPVLVSLRTSPSIIVDSGLLYMSLGLGDFFFAGLLAVQTFKKFGRNVAILSVVAMCISFFIFETLMLNYYWAALPGTVMIICGWLPVVGLRSLKH
jgi:hypothetical protein